MAVVERPRTGPSAAREWLRQATQLLWIAALGWYLTNLGYGFEGTFQRLGEYEFVSQSLSGSPNADLDGLPTGNRFVGTWLAALPVPIPRNYLLGIDTQKGDFERGMWSTLRGAWRHGGWWYYYLYALTVKVPLGTWGLALLAVWVALFRSAYRASWRDEVCVLAPSQSC